MSLSASRKPAGSTSGSRVLELDPQRAAGLADRKRVGPARRAPRAGRRGPAAPTRAKYPSSGWSRLASSSLMTTHGQHDVVLGEAEQRLGVGQEHRRVEHVGDPRARRLGTAGPGPLGGGSCRVRAGCLCDHGGLPPARVSAVLAASHRRPAGGRRLGGGRSAGTGPVTGPPPGAGAPWAGLPGDGRSRPLPRTLRRASGTARATRAACRAVHPARTPVPAAATGPPGQRPSRRSRSA